MFGLQNIIQAQNLDPVKSVANSSQSGHATNIIQGLAVSMQSTALPTLVIILGIIFSYKFAGLYGISIAATTMLL